MYKKIIIACLVIAGLAFACKDQTSFRGTKKADRAENFTDDQTPAQDFTEDKVPDSAITKGSFTVWTEPEDPAPYEKYNVIVQVKLDKNIDSYSKSDLAGHLVGTDGYQQPLGRYGVFDSLKHYPDKGYARLTSRFVPGTYAGVKDTITIKSDILNETQTITIEF